MIEKDGNENGKCLERESWRVICLAYRLEEWRRRWAATMTDWLTVTPTYGCSSTVCLQLSAWNRNEEGWWLWMQTVTKHLPKIPQHTATKQSYCGNQIGLGHLKSDSEGWIWHVRGTNNFASLPELYVESHKKVTRPWNELTSWSGVQRSKETRQNVGHITKSNWVYKQMTT